MFFGDTSILTFIKQNYDNSRKTESLKDDPVYSAVM